jgi:hypothetical protein
MYIRLSKMHPGNVQGIFLPYHTIIMSRCPACMHAQATSLVTSNIKECYDRLFLIQNRCDCHSAADSILRMFEALIH